MPSGTTSKPVPLRELIAAHDDAIRSEILGETPKYYPFVIHNDQVRLVDNPLNRVLRAAALAVSSSPISTLEVKNRALGVARLSEASRLKPEDLRATIDRRSAHYADAISLAHQVLKGVGRTIGYGAEPTWSFLIRTPEMVEAGVRAILKKAFGSYFCESLNVPVAGSTFTPRADLVFGNGLAVADVKYKLTAGNWDRNPADLYQVVAYATAFRAPQAAIIDFANAGQGPRPDVRLGEVRVSNFVWNADEGITPEAAAAGLADQVGSWLGLERRGRVAG